MKKHRCETLMYNPTRKDRLQALIDGKMIAVTGTDGRKMYYMFDRE